MKGCLEAAGPPWCMAEPKTNTPEAAFRAPTVPDGAELWRLVREIGVLDENSCYAYLLLCRDFSGTCLVAEAHGALAGFITGYLPPRRPETLFVWQVGVAPHARRQGLGLQLLLQLIRMQAERGVRYVEATIAPSNRASQRLFHAAAAALGASLATERGFTRGDFGTLTHEEEELIRIGPLPKADE